MDVKKIVSIVSIVSIFLIQIFDKNDNLRYLQYAILIGMIVYAIYILTKKENTSSDN